MAANISLSESEVFLELTDGDTAAEIIGYIESITAPAAVGRGQQYKLFKFVLTNGVQKLTCLMWGDDLITQHSDNIQLNRIIHIYGGKVKMANVGYAMASENFVPFEMIIQKNTSLTYHGFHNAAPILPVVAAEVEFQNLRDVTGLITIRAWVKTPLASTPSRFGNSTYGVGSITDGINKVPVHVNNYTPVLNFQKCDAVIVEGTVKVTGGIVSISIERSENVVNDPNAEPLSLQQVVSANRLFKRRFED